ncbi:MAG: phosphatidylserine decarboxylase family protein [Desulfuromonas sp.]|nr:MAG: phosphatidylserine decarboxylase family protein [Desulfuromonas sp.]
MRNRNQPIAVEGYPFIALFAFVTLVFALLGWTFLTLLLLALTLFTVYFFRNPERLIPEAEDAVVAPADGKIVYAGEVENAPMLDGPAQKVSIFMSVFNVHVNRVPYAGKVIDSFYKKGAFFNAELDKASSENEQSGLLVETTDGRRISFVQIAGLVARRIVCYAEVGDQLERGARYGLIRFGSRVDIYLPTDTALQVRLGDRTVSGETVIGTLP